MKGPWGYDASVASDNREEAFPKSINSNPDPTIFFLPNIAMQVIHFNILGRRSLDLSRSLLENLDPMVGGHMAKPQEAANGPKVQALQLQVQRHTRLGRLRRISFRNNGKKI